MITRKQKIFIVDDHPLVREWVAHLINAEPDLKVCGEADNLEEAARKIRSMEPDLAIIDISLQSASGLDLIKNIRLQTPKTLAVVLSMHEEGVYAERALRAGAKGYVIKRESSEQIIAAVRKVLGGGVYLSDNLALGLAENLVKRADSGLEQIADLLSDREMEIFSLLGQGKKTSQIAEILGIGLKTVHSYCARIKEKVHLSNSTELLREAVCWYEENRKTGAR